MRDPSSFKPLLSLFGAAIISGSCFGQTSNDVAPDFPPGEEPVVVAPIREEPNNLFQGVESIIGQNSPDLMPNTGDAKVEEADPAPVTVPRFPSTHAAPLIILTQPDPSPAAITTPSPTIPTFDSTQPSFLTTAAKSIEADSSSLKSALAEPSGRVESYNNFDLGEFSPQGAVASSSFTQRWKSRLGLTPDDSVNTVVGLSYLAFERDYRSDSRLLSSGAAGALSTGSPDEGLIGGFDFNLARRNAMGKGWEFRYFGFHPGDEIVSLAGGPSTNFAGFAPGVTAPAASTIGLSGIGVGAVSMATVFDDAAIHRVARSSSVNNLEFNFLRLGSLGAGSGCGNQATEFVLGFRALNFDEAIIYSADGIAASATNPTSAQYVSDVSNLLLGLQVGARTERQVRGRLSVLMGTKFGVFNNRIENQQSARYTFADGSTATPSALFGPDAGTAFNVNGTENGLSLLGEIDLGVAYQFSSRVRARIGYRGLAATNIAEAEGQFSENLFQLSDVRNPEDSGQLLLGGAYYGLEFAF